jgi:hypothetical protein
MGYDADAATASANVILFVSISEEAFISKINEIRSILLYSPPPPPPLQLAWFLTSSMSKGFAGVISSCFKRPTDSLLK